MKKSKILIALVLLLTFSLTFTVACEKSSPVQEKLVGTWFYEGTWAFGTDDNTYTFTDNYSYTHNLVVYDFLNGRTNRDERQGTYEITDTEIILTETDGDTTTFTYVYDNDRLVLQYNDSINTYTLLKR